MAILSYPEYKAIFIAHTKCAGTTLYNKFGHLWGMNYKKEDYDFILGDAVVPPNTISKASYWKKILPEYFMFTFIRNPYDRVVSFYFFKIQKQIKGPEKPSFETFIMNFGLWRKIPKFVDILDIPIDEIDFIGRYENLMDDVDKVCKILKVKNKNNKISHLNPSGLRKGIHYRDLYNDNIKRIVEQYFKEDLEKFNYEF